MENTFNQKLIAFAQDLQTLNSGLEKPIPEIGMLEGGIHIMAAMDVGGPLRLFREHVSGPYGSHIEAKNDKFFLEASNLDESHKNDINLVNLLRSVWSTLSPEDKAAIWGHMQLLLKLDQKIKEKQG